MKKGLVFLFYAFIFCATNLFAQTTKIFQVPTTATGSCYNYEYTCGCSGGWCSGCKHAGKDYCGSTSDNIVTTGSGRVVYVSNASNGSSSASGDNRGFGKTVIIAHKTNSGDIYSLYAHLNSINSDITNGKYLTKGYNLGKKGASGGGSNGITHLHFEMKNHSGLGHNPDCTGTGCVGYVKSTLLPVSSRGYYNPNSYIGTQEYRDIALEYNLPSTISKSGVNLNININSPFTVSCNIDIRLALYNTSNTYLGDIQAYTNKTITSGANTINFSKASLSSPTGSYKLRVDYKIPGSSTWIALPTNGSYLNPKTVTLTL